MICIVKAFLLVACGLLYSVPFSDSWSNSAAIRGRCKLWLTAKLIDVAQVSGASGTRWPSFLRDPPGCATDGDGTASLNMTGEHIEI